MVCIATILPNGRQDVRDRSCCTLMKLRDVFDVSPTYLFRGEEDDDGIKLSKNEQELIRLYRDLHADSKEKLMATAEVLVNLWRSTTIKVKKRVGNDEIVKNLLSQRILDLFYHGLDSSLSIGNHT